MKAASASTERSGRDFRAIIDGCEILERIVDVRVTFAPETEQETGVIKRTQAATGELAARIKDLCGSVLPDKVMPYPRCDGRLELLVMAEARWAQIQAGRGLYSVAATTDYATAPVNELYPRLSELCQA